MYNEIIDLLEASYPITLLALVYDILANEFDQLIYEVKHDLTCID